MIRIDERWSLISDPYCWHLKRKEKVISRTGKNKGQEVDSVTTTYHPTLVAALRHAMDYDARLCGELTPVVDAWVRIQQRFTESMVKA